MSQISCNKLLRINNNSIENYINIKCTTENTKRAYKYDLKQFYSWTLQLIDIDVENVNLYKLYEEKVNDRKLSSSTIKRKLTVIRDFLIYLEIPFPNMYVVINRKTGVVRLFEQSKFDFETS